MRSVRDKTPQRVSQLFFFSQKITDEQNTQRRTETLSQPISQNLTAIFGSNALWTLYAGGVLWDRNVGWKGSVRSVSSVREKDLYEECKQSSRGNLTYYLLIWNKSSERWKILTTHQADHTHNTQLSSPTIKDITHKKSACYVLRSSICPSCSQKTPFLWQEGHVLERRKASSSILKSIYSMQDTWKQFTNKRD